MGVEGEVVTVTWTRVEAGRYMSELGEIRRGLNGLWWFSSTARPELSGLPWATLAAAKRWAEACAGEGKG